MIEKMLKFAAGIVLACSLTGCVNLYVRCPGTSSKIATVYQSTQAAAALSYVIMFPQVISWRGAQVEARSSSRETFVMENLITIPIGCIGFCDTACEAVIDTVLLPIDWPLTYYRDKQLDKKTKKDVDDIEVLK